MGANPKPTNSDNTYSSGINPAISTIGSINPDTTHSTGDPGTISTISSISHTTTRIINTDTTHSIGTTDTSNTRTNPNTASRISNTPNTTTPCCKAAGPAAAALQQPSFSAAERTSLLGNAAPAATQQHQLRYHLAM